MYTVYHIFKDGSTDPSKKTVPAELVRRIHTIRVEAERRQARRLAESNREGAEDAAISD
jgi:hypothetical protein